MKVLSAVVFSLTILFWSGNSYGQDVSAMDDPEAASRMLDTVIRKEPGFRIRAIHPWSTEMQDTIVRKEPGFRIEPLHAWSTEMQDTVITKDPAFIVKDYMTLAREEAESHLSKRELYVKRMRDSLSAIGSALLRTAYMQDTTIALDPKFVVTPILPWPSEMQDTIIAKDPSFVVKEMYIANDVLARREQMQDTTIVLEPAFVVKNIYAPKDRYDAIRDSITRSLTDASKMQDTTIVLEPAFRVIAVYAARDKEDAARELLLLPGKMQDTVIQKDPSFVVQDLYTIKDSLDILRDSLEVVAKQQRLDSVKAHWAGWKKYEVLPTHPYPIAVPRGVSRTGVQYDIADFYLYLNGELVNPAGSDYDFFEAGCLTFKYDDTLLLNSGLGFDVGVGVGIKIFQDKFISTLHANKRNALVYKQNEDDTVYIKSIVTEPVTQTLKLETDPAYASAGKVIVGEYTAGFKKFYLKKEDGDVAQKYSVRIIFRCRVTGGINSLKTLSPKAGN